MLLWTPLHNPPPHRAFHHFASCSISLEEFGYVQYCCDGEVAALLRRTASELHVLIITVKYRAVECKVEMCVRQRDFDIEVMKHKRTVFNCLLVCVCGKFIRRNVHIEDFGSKFNSNIRVIKSMKMRWARHLARRETVEVKSLSIHTTPWKYIWEWGNSPTHY